MSTAPSTTLTQTTLSQEQLVSAAIVSVLIATGTFITSGAILPGAIAISYTVFGCLLYFGLSLSSLTSHARTRIALATSILGLGTASIALVAEPTTAVLLSAFFAVFALIQIQIGR